MLLLLFVALQFLVAFLMFREEAVTKRDQELSEYFLCNICIF